MTLVRISKDWPSPDLMRQTPEHSGQWQNIQFTLDPVENCDYLVVLNRLREKTIVTCPPDNIWLLIQEPPVPEYRWLDRGFSSYARIYTPDSSYAGSKVVPSHGALPWHVDKSYDQLAAALVPQKPLSLSWITSSKDRRPGHRKRLKFMEQIKGQIEFDLMGRGFAPLANKWDGLAPYRYSLAVENHRAPYYWTEKIADCFLAWTMPIYYGCQNIADYFPAEAMVQIDLDDPDVVEIIQEAVAGDRWLRNREALDHARRLVLDEHQFFPFVSRLIQADHEARGPENQAARLNELTGIPNLYPQPPLSKLKRKIRALFGRTR